VPAERFEDLSRGRKLEKAADLGLIRAYEILQLGVNPLYPKMTAIISNVATSLRDPLNFGPLGRWYWRCAGNFLRIAARRRIVDHIGRQIRPGYWDRSRRVLVGRRCRWVAWRPRRGARRLRRARLLSEGR
jgi:hypothetical protein